MKHLAALMLSLAAAGVNAQTVYRCGSTYSESPCPQPTLIDATDARTAAQRADAQRVAADERQLGRRMEQERLALAAAQKPAGATSLSGPPPKAAERARTKQIKWPKKPKKADAAPKAKANPEAKASAS
jgi:hypothetical protein